MTLKELAEFKKQVSKETNISAENAQEMSLKILNIRMRYLDMYSDEKQKLKAIEVQMTRLYNSLFKKYRYGNNDYKAETIKEVEAFIKDDDDYYNLTVKYEIQTVVVDYLKEICSGIEKYGFLIKSYLDFQMLKMGNVPK